jgi:hypothetical protein
LVGSFDDRHIRILANPPLIPVLQTDEESPLDPQETGSML